MREERATREYKIVHSSKCSYTSNMFCDIKTTYHYMDSDRTFCASILGYVASHHWNNISDSGFFKRFYEHTHILLVFLNEG
jgi:hypothetical protein